MQQTYRSATACLWASRAVAGLLGVLAVLMPRAVRWYGQLRLLSSAGQRVILAGYYLCLIPTGLALLELDRLMRRIRQGRSSCRTTSGAFGGSSGTAQP
ncbi:MAG: hypothetical protein ACLSHU_02455 [Oscillospiraceae bacterium]